MLAPGDDRCGSNRLIALEEDLLCADRLFAGRGLRADVRAVGALEPRFDVVGQKDLENLRKLVAQGRVEDGDDRLDTAVQVTPHPVGAPDVHLAVSAVLERIDPRMLEEAPEDAADSDRLADPGDAGSYDAHAADDQIDRDAC